LICDRGHLLTGCFPVSFLIRWAYQVNDHRIAGLPDWARNWDAAYDVEAKSARPLNLDECRAAARALLADRFALTAHRDLRETSGYMLLAIDGAAKLRPSGTARINGQTVADEGLSMPDLARLLGGHPALNFEPVKDRTGLPGRYAFDLQFSTRPDDDRPSVFTALKDQLGLRLQPAKLRVEFLVVDRIERASPN
jgi:uncharacterized protein (TIGR03435 family)